MSQREQIDQAGEVAPGIPKTTDGHSENSVPPKFTKGSVLQVGTAVPVAKDPASPNTKQKGDRDWIG